MHKLHRHVATHPAKREGYPPQMDIRADDHHSTSLFLADQLPECESFAVRVPTGEFRLLNANAETIEGHEEVALIRWSSVTELNEILETWKIKPPHLADLEPADAQD